MFIHPFLWGVLASILVIVVYILCLLIMAWAVNWLPYHARCLGWLSLYPARLVAWIDNGGEGLRPFIAAAVMASAFLTWLAWWRWPIQWFGSWSGWIGFGVVFVIVGAILAVDYIRQKKGR
ncbi:hypothetical protein [uncultured Pseudodesulfovibrio sp.]|uniref:hypothetical protein n=1 Tax=uncultured Pseudodesulfovibrio sp. TaxID=2035858 RepID=UPI0029C88891|nr:hypothetical protein [uncultured Pseudodesulfovibrio sp.]